MSGRTIRSVELVCERGCGYSAAVGNAVESAQRRMTPAECPRCGAGVKQP